MEEGGLVVIFPSGVSANAVRDCQAWLKQELSDEGKALKRHSKQLEINKCRNKATGNRELVVVISQRVRQDEKKLVPDSGEWAPDYRGTPSLTAAARALTLGFGPE
jgi:hypothetical protein